MTRRRSPHASRETCEWRFDGIYDDVDVVWSTGCGQLHVFIHGGPIENQQKFCGYCGRPIRAAAAESGATKEQKGAME